MERPEIIPQDSVNAVRRSRIPRPKASKGPPQNQNPASLVRQGGERLVLPDISPNAPQFMNQPAANYQPQNVNNNYPPQYAQNSPNFAPPNFVHGPPQAPQAFAPYNNNTPNLPSQEPGMNYNMPSLPQHNTPFPHAAASTPNAVQVTPRNGFARARCDPFLDEVEVAKERERKKAQARELAGQVEERRQQKEAERHKREAWERAEEARLVREREEIRRAWERERVGGIISPRMDSMDSNSGRYNEGNEMVPDRYRGHIPSGTNIDYGQHVNNVQRGNNVEGT